MSLSEDAERTLFAVLGPSVAREIIPLLAGGNASTNVANTFTAGPQTVKNGSNNVAILGSSATGHSALGVGSLVDQDHSAFGFAPCLASLNIEETFTTYPPTNVTDNNCLSLFGTFNMPNNPFPSGAMDFECLLCNAEIPAGNTSDLSSSSLYVQLMQTRHSGSGHLSQMFGHFYQGFNLGGGTIDFWCGAYLYLQQNAGTVTFGANVYLAAPFNSGTWVDHAALYIEDHSGVGSASSDNIHSAGSGSKNVFEGSVAVGRTTPCDASAVFEIDSTTRGALLPRMTTTQKNAISSPAEGLEVYDTTLHAKCVYNGTAWKTVTVS